MSEREHNGHTRDEHVIEGSPHEQARRVVARHLCEWISGHGAPIDHFLADADLIMQELHEHDLRFHIAGPTVNSSDGFIEVVLKNAG